MRRVRMNRSMRGRRRQMPRRSSLASGKRLPVRLVIAAVIALFGIISYFGASAVNPVTGQTQRVDLSIQDEIAIGLQATPAMMAQHGGMDPNQADQQRVDAIGMRLLRAIDAEMPWQFEFHLLTDSRTINAFALPGGQVFITRALYDELTTDGQVAGVIGHEIGHVIERHGAQRMAKGKLTQMLVSASGVATENATATQAAAAVGQLINMSYGRGDEIESDKWGVRLLGAAGYDPRAMIRVMEVLRDAGGGGGKAEFFSTHPNPENRIGKIEAVIAELYPNSVPNTLEP